MNKETFDLIGIGLGPFNLGLDALLHPIKSINSLFLEQKSSFDWHPGLMIPGTTMQVGFYADLVTLADPTSPFSYLAFLKEQHRLINFGIWEKTYISRIDYRNYCRSVADKLGNILFNHKALEINTSKKGFTLSVKELDSGKHKQLDAKNIVLGIGSAPFVPRKLGKDSGRYRNVLHSSNYMNFRSQLMGKSVLVIGSGQSAAEIILDLLTMNAEHRSLIRWVTRSERLIPMDFSKLNLELSTPDYITHFKSLSSEKRNAILARQQPLYKGINKELIDRIYDHLYEWGSDNKERPNFEIHTGTEALDIQRGQEGDYIVEVLQYARDCHLKFNTDFVILATGYSPRSPVNLLSPLKEAIQLDEECLPICDAAYNIHQGKGKIFVQNAEMTTHGFNAADLSLGPYRNACIINTLLNKKYYDISNLPTFHHF